MDDTEGTGTVLCCRSDENNFGKFKKAKYPYFFYFQPFGRDMAILLFLEHVNKNLSKTRKWLYLGEITEKKIKIISSR